MEYRGIRYTIRTGIDGQYRVAIHPEGVEMAAKKIFGARESAKVHAYRMINKWLDAKFGVDGPQRREATRAHNYCTD
jgi:hypothetical protein